MHLLSLLRDQFREALADFVTDASAMGRYLDMVRPAQNPEHGDYQANFAMPLSKALQKKPQAVAGEVVERLPLGSMLEPPTVAGPGFINVRFRTDWLAERLRSMAADDRLGVAKAEPPRTYVVDYSGPNVAKPLHVGHLRSTIIGESLSRLLRFLGHRVIGDNHLGDWGTQFGMLLYGYKHFVDEAAYRADPVRELARLYVLVRNRTRGTDVEETVGKKKKKRTVYTPEEQAILEECRRETAKLHAGDPVNVDLWKSFMPPSMAEIESIYRRLDVHFDHQYGESFYNPLLPKVVDDLLAKGVAQRSRGAVVVGGGDADEADESEEGAVSLIQKSDGAFTYTTTDLATIRYRVETWAPDAILYVVDFRQGDHFKTLFAAAQQWGHSKVLLVHVSFGSVLGEDGKPKKTREGSAESLEGLLDQAVEEGRRKYEETAKERAERGEEVPDLNDRERNEIAEAVGIGAVKYADLSQNRTSDYIFSYDKMLATDGNTATYMQYAYVRCRGIFRRGGIDEARFRTDPPPVQLPTPQERALALQLLRYEEALRNAADEYMPHYLTAYLWDLAKAYSGFFVNCPVLKAETPELRDSRLLLCDLTGRVIRQTLDLLGIKTIERM